MSKVITMDQALATVEQFCHMVENNEGVEIEAVFWVTEDELHKIADQQNLDIERAMFSTDFKYWATWWPTGNRNLTIDFHVK